MYGKITFDAIEDMAEFLRWFQGTTAIFESYKDGDKWILEFKGGF